MRDRLEFSDLLSECRARACLVDGLFQQALHGSDVCGCDTNSLPLHGFRKQLQTGAYSAENCAHRNSNIVEYQFTDRGRPQSHFFELLSSLKTMRAFFYDECRDTS